LATKRLELIVNFASTGRPKSVDGFRTFELCFKKYSIVNFGNFWFGIKQRQAYLTHL